MRRGNVPLYAGVAMLVVLLTATICGPFVAPYDPTEMHTTRLIPGSDGHNIIRTPPFRPGDEFPLGTDYLGRDVLSRFLSGCRYTLLLALGGVVVRLLAAVPLGLLASQPALGLVGRAVQGMAALGGAAPALFLSLMAIPVLLSFMDTMWGSMAAFTLVIGLVGAPRLAEEIRRSSRGVMAQPFIEAAHAAGCTPARVALRHVLPVLLPRIAVAVPLEIANVLTLIGQLGLFGLYVGRSTAVESWMDLTGAAGGWRLEPATGEWAGALAWAREFVRAAPWMFLPAAFGFLWAILAVSLLGEGLRRRMRTGA